MSSQFSEGVDCVYLSFRPVPFPSMPVVLSRRSAVPRLVRVHATLRGSRSRTVAGKGSRGARKTTKTDPTNSEAGQTAGYKTLDRRRSQHQSRLTSFSCTTPAANMKVSDTFSFSRLFSHALSSPRPLPISSSSVFPYLSFLFAFPSVFASGLALCTTACSNLYGTRSTLLLSFKRKSSACFCAASRLVLATYSHVRVSLKVESLDEQRCRKIYLRQENVTA